MSSQKESSEMDFIVRNDYQLVMFLDEGVSKFVESVHQLVLSSIQSEQHYDLPNRYASIPQVVITRPFPSSQLFNLIGQLPQAPFFLKGGNLQFQADSRQGNPFDRLVLEIISSKQSALQQLDPCYALPVLDLDIIFIQPHYAEALQPLLPEWPENQRILVTGYGLYDYQGVLSSIHHFPVDKMKSPKQDSRVKQKKPTERSETFYVFLDDLFFAMQHFRLAYDSTAGSKPLNPAIPLSRYCEADEYADANPDEMEALLQCCEAMHLKPEELNMEKLFEWYHAEVEKQ